MRALLGRLLGPAYAETEQHLTVEGLTLPGFVRASEDQGPGRIVAVVPAYNEEALIAAALESLAAKTVDNRYHRADAIDEVLATLLERLSDDDAVLVMDADTRLSERFLSVAAARLREPEGAGPRIGGVGGIFFGANPVEGLLGRLQNNEYVRYAREIGRCHGRADILTGTATLFSVRALRDVRRARRCGELPKGAAVHDVEALTEDDELTLALKHLGYVCVSPKDCTVATSARETWAYRSPDAARGRDRWSRAWRRASEAVYGVAGAVRSAVRLLDLDPLGVVLGTGEGNGLALPRLSRRQGFGGNDVPPTHTRRPAR